MTTATTTTTAAKTAKPVNYTPEQTRRMIDFYTSEGKTEDAAKALALEMGKTLRSVVAKLSREGVYEKKTYTTKMGEKPQKKDETADAIGAVLKLTESEIESLTKANKTALVKIFAALAYSKPIEG
jgi:hypothetical protein